VDNYGNPEASRRDTLLYPDDAARPSVAQSPNATPAITPADLAEVTEEILHSAHPVYGIQMKHRRPAGVWLLTLATLGIYGLVYWYKIHSELRGFDHRRHNSPVFELMSIFLMAWTIILPFMSIGSLAQKIRIAQSTAGLPQDCSGTRGCWLAVLFGTHVIYYQRKLNEIIDANNVAGGERIQLKV
jgi:Domain of unknown function (DUF4234)